MGATRSAFRRAAVACLVAVAGVLAGCKVGPDFQTPKADTAQAWLEAGNPRVRTDRQDYERWWTAFNDPVLDRLIDTAYRQNLTLLEAGTRVLQARAVLGVAIGEFYPQQQQIGASVSYNQASQADVASSPAASIGNYWQAALASQVVWELDFWGKFRRGVQSADAAYLGSIASYDDVLVTLLGDVATTYIGIRTLERELAIAQENVVRQRRALQIARDRNAGGTATGLDVYQATNVLAQTQSTIPNLSAQIQKGKDALCVLLGTPPSTLADVLAPASGIPVPPAEVAVGIPADLVRRRPDIRAAELAAASQSEQIGIAKADLFPAFSLSGIFGTSATDVRGNRLNSVFSSKGIQFAFGLDFSWPILNYGQITNNVRVQDAKLQTLLVDYRNTVLKAQQEVEDNLAGFVQGRQQVDLLRQSVAAATKALDIATTQYLLGTRDFTTVLTAEQNLLQAQTSLASAAGQLSTSLADLYRALGGGWQIRDGHDFVDDATRAQMRARTDWGRLLPPADAKQPPAPGLPGPSDRGPDVRAPQW